MLMFKYFIGKWTGHRFANKLQRFEKKYIDLQTIT